MTNYVIPDPNMALIVDISKWQNDIHSPQYVDFAQMKAKGVSGVIMKAGQGLYLDRDFIENWARAKSAGMPRGVYWYYDNRVDPIRQAELLVKSAALGQAELGIWLDLEDRQEGTNKGWKNWYAFLSKVKEMVPQTLIGIYTGYYYFKEFTEASRIPKPSLDWFKQFPLWIAAYKTGAPLIPKPWDKYTIWQFTDLLDGIYYGAESKELDGNYFAGSLAEFSDYFHLEGVPSETLAPAVDGMDEVVGLEVVYKTGKRKFINLED